MCDAAAVMFAICFILLSITMSLLILAIVYFEYQERKK